MRHLITPLIAGVVSVFFAAPVYCDIGDQIFKLLGEDNEPEAEFGTSVAISGTTAIIGATHGYDKYDSFNGSAFLYNITTAQQLFKITPADKEPGDYFGISVGISGSIAIIGAHQSNNNSGSAYLFDSSTGQQLFKLLPDDGAPNDYFGNSVGISGNIAIVGALAHDHLFTNSGAAYLFDINTGQQLCKLVPNDPEEYDRFGRSVAITGAPGQEVAIVGSFLDDDAGNSSGSAYIFNASTGQQLLKLVPIDGAEGEQFGVSVAISGPFGEEVAIIGALYDNDNGSDSGSAYLFDARTGNQMAKLLPEDGGANDNFGSSVGILDNTVIVGARHGDYDGGYYGSAYLFDATTGIQITKLVPDDGVAAGDLFGSAVAINGEPGEEVALVGSQWDDDNGNASGSAYLFDASVYTPCPWDIDGSGSVDTGDLLALFAQWGTFGHADFDESGIVDTNDLLILFANWGPCK